MCPSIVSVWISPGNTYYERVLTLKIQVFSLKHIFHLKIYLIFKVYRMAYISGGVLLEKKII